MTPGSVATPKARTVRESLHGYTEPDPERYGYDVSLVPSKSCLICHKPIGDEAYLENTVLARFGQMLIAHRSCVVNDRGAA